MNNKKEYNKNNDYDYIKYLTLDKMNQKIIKSSKKGIDLENEIYSKNNVPLTEKEKIYFEVSRIYEKIKSKEYFNNVIKDNKNIYLLLNRLDIFLINSNDLKNKINKYTNEELNLLRDDFSIFN